ncbi:MAG: 2OG-Fe(II) oxygenase [Alphaproteobacteria bacterium]|nr:2OG-Fe(II) oxygenase [Alphaproteobacteria bacterium]
MSAKYIQASPKALTPVVPNLVSFGSRLPNVAMEADLGRHLDYFRDMTHGPTLFLYAAGSDRVLQARAEGVTVVAIDDRIERSEVGGADLDIWCVPDINGALRVRLFGAERQALLADANQRVVAAWSGAGAFSDWLSSALSTLARPAAQERREGAPVLLLPNVLEPRLCRALIERLDSRMEEGRVAIIDKGETKSVELPDKKRRRDHKLPKDDPLYLACAERVSRRVMPELYKAFWIEKLRHEGYYLARYDDDRADFFAAHRDNNTPGTARRRMAISMELNENYEGGGLMFPEYSDHRHRAPAGGALAFSCNLMHEAVPVSKGSRYVLLAFMAAP